MKKSTHYRFLVGIDTSKLVLDLCLEDAQTGRQYVEQVDNTPDGFAELDHWLTNHGATAKQTLLCSEHSGRYSERLAGWAASSQWDHALVKTTAAKKVAPEHHRKNDSFDADLLAEYARRFTDKLRLHEAREPVVRQIERLRRERRYLVDQRASLKQKLGEAEYHNADMTQIKAFYQQHIELLSEQIHWMEGRIRELIISDEQLHTCYKRILTAPGVGEVIASFWLTLFARKDHLNPRQISSRFGFAPHEFQSGTSIYKKKRSAQFGNTEMRKLMHQAARSVSYHHAHFGDYYHRKLEEGKPERLVINNIINKIIRTLCAMWNNKMDYDPAYRENLKKIHQNA